MRRLLITALATAAMSMTNASAAGLGDMIRAESPIADGIALLWGGVVAVSPSLKSSEERFERKYSRNQSIAPDASDACLAEETAELPKSTNDIGMYLFGPAPLYFAI